MLLQQAIDAITLGSLDALIATGLAIRLSIPGAANLARGSPVMQGVRPGVVGAAARPSRPLGAPQIHPTLCGAIRP